MILSVYTLPFSYPHLSSTQEILYLPENVCKLWHLPGHLSGQLATSGVLGTGGCDTPSQLKLCCELGKVCVKTKTIHSLTGTEVKFSPLLSPPVGRKSGKIQIYSVVFSLVKMGHGLCLGLLRLMATALLMVRLGRLYIRDFQC